ncbi:hypothetical protein ACFQLX_15925 [Streptomyces polyrhachis]|uniref:ATP-binding protein n=1 Tax=Streptomyces polyrhachis TaxID=1282885 RepID=A0ABW2GL82_9ACTN
MPRAVGLDARGRGVAPAYPRGGPVLRIYGGRGTGKTSVCQRLHDTYVNRLHVAKWPRRDADPALSASGPQTGLIAARPLAALAWLVHELNAPAGRFGRMEFPRFTYGLLAAATLEDVPQSRDDDAGAMRQRHFVQLQRSLEEALDDNADGASVRARFKPLAQQLVPLLGWIAPGLTPLTGLLQQVVGDAFGGGGGGGQPDAAAVRWWDGQLDGIAGAGIGKLLDYVMGLRQQLPAQARNDLEQRLAAAFLADMDAHYDRRHLRIWPLPLIILDDTHTPTGERLLSLLLTAYAQAAGHNNAQGGRVRRPVIVCAGLGPPSRAASVRDRMPLEAAEIDQLDWRSPDTQDVNAWQVWLRAPAMEAGGIATALGNRAPRGLPNLIEQISAGRGGLAWPLITAAQEDLRLRGSGRLNQCTPHELGPTLLALPPAGTAGERHVADVLLHFLVPDRGLIEPLLPWAVALRLDDVADLPAPGGAPPDGVEGRIRDFLREEHWSRSRWAGEGGFVPVVADRVLRELLLHRLRTRCSPEAAGPDAEEALTYWTRLHTAARGRYSAFAHDREGVGRSAYLHHSLALGERAAVVAALHAMFEEGDRPRWLADLQFICAAPRPPDGYARRRPEPPDVPCTACRGPQPDARHSVLGHLVDLLWSQSTLASLYTDDPEGPNNRLRSFLGNIEIAYDDDAATVNATALWPHELAGGRRVPQLPITERGH